MTTKAETAVNEFKSGCNCSQALVSAFSETLGYDRSVALKAAAAFGGGMGCEGEACGAVTGALMVLGMRYGNSPSGGKGQSQCYGLSKELIKRFRQKNGSMICRELLECDISTEDGMDAAKSKGVFTTVCPKLVRDAAEIVEQLL